MRKTSASKHRERKGKKMVERISVPGQERDGLMGEVLTRGVVDIITKDGLAERLREGKPLRIKYGVDPTKPSAHIGHAVPIRKLRQFQELGHTAVIIIGDYTARVGDPSGRSTVREALTAEQVQENAKLYFEQIYKILDKDKTEVHLQSEWYGDFDLEKVIRLMQKVTYAELMAHETFKIRVKKGIPLYFHEMFYPLLQGFDSVAIKADVELGGDDQRFNFVLTRDLQRAYAQKPEEVILMRYIPGIDGQEKMSKSLGNSIDILDTPEDMYFKTMSISDDLMPVFFELGTDLPMEEIDALLVRWKAGQIHPMDLKKTLAGTITRLYHSQEKVEMAAKNFERQVQRSEIPEGIKEVQVDKTSVNLSTILVQEGIVASKSEVRRLIKQRGIKVNGQVIDGPNIDVTNNVLVQVGSRRFIKIVSQ